MSGFLASAVYHTQNQANEIGLDKLSRAQITEITAPLLGYETRRHLLSHVTHVQQAIAHPDAAILVDENAAIRKAAALLSASDMPTTSARRYVSLLIENVRCEVAAPVYAVDGAFLEDHLDPYVPPFFLAELYQNDQVRAVHAKVSTPCEFVKIDDVDSVTYFWTSRDVWRVSCMVVMLPRGADGKPYDEGEYLIASTEIEYAKLDRAVVSIRPSFFPARASANRYHASMGGDWIQ